ncbi:MAG: Rieske 2Fe-2S domain-containing protein [Nitrososphaerales archaeon]|nr:Rieske 2Fe-2S domain-containing protein [Nitrososphaerales archaeon]
MAAVPAGPPVRPASVPPPMPPSRQQAPKNAGRRNFVKALFTISAVLTIIPYVPWGEYLSSSVTGTGKNLRQKVVTDTNKANGAGSGKSVNVNDLTTFPPNSSWLITYPSSGDLTVDSQNPDTFVKWQLIRLPDLLGGGKKDVSAFVAFSKVCVHLWCSPNYNPARRTNPSDETYQCPCHGSIYRIPDGLSIAGPASLQPPPTDVIPILTLSTDSGGFLYVEPPIWDVYHNGVIGYGRYIPDLTENTDAYKKYLGNQG